MSYLPPSRRRASRAGARSCRRAAGPLRGSPGRTGVVVGVSKPRRLDQQRTERGDAGPRGSLVVDFPRAYFSLDSRLAPLFPLCLRVF
jgi:hypothetical protein